MVKTMREFRKKIEELRKELKSVYDKRLLNAEGIDTMKAYEDLLDIAVFYEDLKEFARLKEVNEILVTYNDCKEVRHVRWFLEKQR